MAVEGEPERNGGFAVQTVLQNGNKAEARPQPGPRSLHRSSLSTARYPLRICEGIRLAVDPLFSSPRNFGAFWDEREKDQIIFRWINTSDRVALFLLFFVSLYLWVFFLPSPNPLFLFVFPSFSFFLLSFFFSLFSFVSTPLRLSRRYQVGTFGNQRK